MNLDKVKKEIKNLRQQLQRADYQYYVLSEPEISDKEYDNLLKNLKTLEEAQPQLVTSDSPTQRVSGGLLKGFSTVKHRKKMLSLDNTYSIDELRMWEAKIKRILKRGEELDYFVELKMDGISIALTYEDARLTRGATRGDGETGEDVTANIKTIKSIPLKLLGKTIPKLIEIKGEVYIGKEDFKKLNQRRFKSGEQAFANPRNAAGGSLKLLDPALVSRRNLRCFVHSFGVAQGYNFVTQQEFLKKAGLWGSCLNTYNKYCKNLKEVIDYCLYWQSRRESLDYEVDGVVVKVNSFNLQKELGHTLKSPRWAVAYKFPAQQVTTKVIEVEFGVGRTGIITPTALLLPVECSGVTISRATLHNFDEVKRLGIKKGDTVLLERAGEVIPKIIKVITSKRTGKEKKISVPPECPVCGEGVDKEKEGEVYWYCINPNCPAQIKRSLIHFASRGAMDIEGMGESVAEELVNRGLIKSLSDIYHLRKEEFLKLPLFKNRRASNLITAMEKSKGKPLSRFLFGLGIKHVGEKAAFILAEKFKNIDSFFKLKKSDLEQIDEIGPAMASSIVKFFSSRKTKAMIGEFKKAGLKLTQEEAPRAKSKITGKVFVFTGELQNISRNQAQEKVQSQGGSWAAAVSKNTDFVVAGANPGSKYAKARQLGVLIISEKDFLKLIK